MTDIRRQKTEDGYQKTDDRGQKTEDRLQITEAFEVGSRIAEVGKRKIEDNMLNKGAYPLDGLPVLAFLLPPLTFNLPHSGTLSPHCLVLTTQSGFFPPSHLLTFPSSHLPTFPSSFFSTFHLTPYTVHHLFLTPFRTPELT